jgi:hypothetical protein
LKKEILSDDFKKRKIFWKNIAENFLENWKVVGVNRLFGHTIISSSFLLALQSVMDLGILDDPPPDIPFKFFLPPCLYFQ